MRFFIIKKKRECSRCRLVVISRQPSLLDQFDGFRSQTSGGNGAHIVGMRRFWRTSLNSQELGNEKSSIWSDRGGWWSPYKGTSLFKKRIPLGPCSRPMPRALWWSYGGGHFSLSEVPPQRQPFVYMYAY